MVDLALRAQFHRARSLWLGLALVRDLAWSLALLFASGLLCFHLDRLLVFSPPARLLWGTGTLALTAAVAAGRAWLSWRRQPDDRAVALRMERKHPDLRERLLSAVELDRLAEEDRRRFSPGLLAVVQEEAKRASFGLDFRRAVTWAEASPALAACALAGLACLLQASVTPAAVAAWWGRMLSPGADIPVYRDTRVRVSPREVLLLRGGDLGIAIATEGRAVDAAVLHFRVGTGSWSQVTLRPPFRHRLQGLTETTQYFATAGDGRSDRGTARVVDPPGLTGLRLRYRFPAYMARPDQTASGVSGTLSVPAGTRIELALAASKPLRSASLEWGSQQTVIPVDGTSASGAVTLRTDTSLRVRLRDTDGFAAPASQRLDFHAVPDQAPEVRLEQPNGDQDVVADASVPLHVVATDDYGLRQLALAHRLERTGASSSPPGAPERLAEGGRTRRELAVRARWNLAGLSLRPGDVLVYHAEADDYDDLTGPHAGRSGEQRLRIVDRAEMERRLAEGWTEWDRQLAQVIQEQAATREAVRAATNAAALAEAERRQRDLASRADDLSRRAGELVEMARTNHLAAEPTLARQERVGTELSDISRRAMPEAADRIRDTASNPASRGQAETQQAEIERRLQALRRQAQPESDLEALARRAEELARAQAELQGQSQRILPQTLGLTLAELVPDQRTTLVRLSQSQTALQQTTGQYEETLQGAARSGPEPAVAASHFMRERAIPERQGQAAQHVAGNTLARAAAGQQTAAADLRRVAALLRRPQQATGRQTARQQAIARAARQLERMMQQHADLMRRTAARPDAARSRQLARQERALRQQAARMSEQLRRAGVPSQSMQSAAQRMAQAERQLNRGTPRAAQSPQQQAQEAMRQMAQQLQDPRGDRQADAEREQLRRALSELAQRQGTIGKALQRSNQDTDRASSAQKLAPRQDAVSRSARSLQRKMPSETFRSAMGQAQAAMERTGKALRRGDTGSAPLTDSRKAERLLQQMARALEEQTPGASQNGRPPSGSSGSMGQNARELARRLADLKLLRSMEQGLRDETGEADKQSADREERLRDLARRQSQTRSQTARVGEALRRMPGVGQRVGEAAGAMGQAQRGLQGGSAGAETQGAQGTAIMRLTQAIGQGQRQLQAMAQPMPGQGQTGNQSQAQNPNRGQRPMLDSLDVHGTDEGGSRALVPGGRRGFGLLSPGDQQALRQGGREKVPADYADLVRRYYQTLSGRAR